VKAVAVTAALVACRRTLTEIRPAARHVLASVGLGLVVCVLWVLIDKNVPYAHLGARTAFDPTNLRGTPWWAVFLGIRLYGLILMVPVMEEVFWRSFLLRYLTAHDFWKLPVGTFSALAFWAMVAASALAHPEWVVGAVASIAYALWLRRTGSLFAVVVAHAATNAALGAYVLATGAWQYW
jgi:CAAX prenyl protease-like protein